MMHSERKNRKYIKKESARKESEKRKELQTLQNYKVNCTYMGGDGGTRKRIKKRGGKEVTKKRQQKRALERRQTGVGDREGKRQ